MGMPQDQNTLRSINQDFPKVKITRLDKRVNTFLWSERHSSVISEQDKPPAIAVTLKEIIETIQLSSSKIVR